MSPRLVLHQLIAYEQRFRSWYRTLGQRAEMSAEARFFWKCMAEDEHHHILMLEYCDRLLDLLKEPPPLSDGLLAEAEAEVITAEAALQRIDLNIDEALQYALKLETSVVKELEKMWIQRFPASVDSFFQDLEPDYEVHYRRFIEAVDALSGNRTLHDQALAVLEGYHRQQRN